MSFNVMKIEAVMDQTTFIEECLSLGIEETYIVELIVSVKPEAEQSSSAKALVYKEVEEIKKRLESAKEVVKETPVVERQDGAKTIHSVIMYGLRNGKENAEIVGNLKAEFPEVDEKKLKQRMYEYRNHFRSGKIK